MSGDYDFDLNSDDVQNMAKPIGCLGVIGLVVLVFAPYLFTLPGLFGINYADTGQIGDTIGGVAGPIISILAAIITFMAFYVQYIANKKQVEQFKDQAKDTAVQRFENKYYEMIRIHNNNAEEIEIDNRISRRKAFIQMVDKLKVLYHMLTMTIGQIGTEDIGKENKINIAYIAFFMGVGDKSDMLTSEILKDYGQDLIHNYIENIKSYRKKSKIAENKYEVTVQYGYSDEFTARLEYYPFDGHVSRLGHYYRHLFQTVSYVVDNEGKLSVDLYEYIKTIRAQLSSHEQLLLYYNGLSVLGRPWLEKGFFTKYKMIKNLPIPIADIGPDPRRVLDEYRTNGHSFFEWDEISLRMKRMRSAEN